MHLSGDGAFDSRGYSAAWCRYFILDAETNEVLHCIIMHKTQTGSSGTMEVRVSLELCEGIGLIQVACLEQGLRELADKIGGIQGIASLVTDRHSAVSKMMREKFAGIVHTYDPWHYFRNITLSLVSVSK